MMKFSSLLLLWTAVALGSCSKKAPAPVPPEAIFAYILDGQTYSTTAIVANSVVAPRGFMFHATPISVMVNGRRYQDRVLVSFSGAGSGPYVVHTLQLYRIDERGQLQLLEYQTDVAATATPGPAAWSGTFAGKSTDALGQVVSTLSNGTFAHIPLR